MAPTETLPPEERRARALRELLVRRIIEAPEAAVAHGGVTLQRMRAADTAGHAGALFDAWERLLDGPVEEIVTVLTDPAHDQLASSSPFAGLLAPHERWDALRATRGAGATDAA